MRPARTGSRPASSASFIARAMRTGSSAFAIAVFMSTPSQPSSIAMAASEAVPMPASTSTGTFTRSMMICRFHGLMMPMPEPMREASGITATQPRSSRLRASIGSSLHGGSTSRRLGSTAFWPMLVRRMATVTICAPLASMARRVSSKSRYLPVPTSRRERYALPATTSESAPMSATPDRDHDFDAIAVGERLGAEAAARHDLAVALDREPPPGEGELVDQLGEGEGRGKLARSPVEEDADRCGHGEIIGRDGGKMCAHAGVAQWQGGSFPSLRRGFDSLHPLQIRFPVNAVAARWSIG